MATTTIDRKHTVIMTVADVAEHLRVHRSTIYRLLREGELPAFRVGADWRFQREAIDQWRTAATVDPRG